VLVLFFLVVVVADAGFFVDGAEAVGGAGFVEDCLGERGSGEQESRR